MWILAPGGRGPIIGLADQDQQRRIQLPQLRQAPGVEGDRGLEGREGDAGQVDRIDGIQRRHPAVGPAHQPDLPGGDKGLTGQIRFGRIRIRHPRVLGVDPQHVVADIRLASGGETVHEQHHIAPLLERRGPVVQPGPHPPTPMQRHHGGSGA
jgi:hypothetical protein